MPQTKKKLRFVTLDVLRGFFVLVIIIDHLNRFPSWFSWVTGQGRLWVSAGEGFFIISGLLVGYTRGFKKLNMPMWGVVKLLYKRAAVLYLTAITASSILLLLTLHSKFPAALQPSIVVPEHSLKTAVYQILTFHYVFEWVYFLKFYTASFVIAPVFIWLLRKRQTVLPIVLAFAVWLFGYIIKQDWLQWQVLFFVPAVFGFHLEAIQKWWRSLAHKRRRLFEYSAMSFSVVALLTSTFWVLGWNLVKGPHAVMGFDRYVSIRHTIDPIFYRVQLSLGRVLLSLLVFIGIYIIFNKARARTRRYTDWLLLPLGTHSLVAYVVHAFILAGVQSMVPTSTSSTYNTFLAVAVLGAVYLLTRNRFVRRIVPS